MQKATEWFANAALNLRLRSLSAVRGAQLARLARNPRRAQHRLLMGIVSANAQTTFGRRHAFDAIVTYADFVARVPVSTFEQLRPYVAAEIERGEAALTIEPPLCYVRTSGTTDKPKDLPLTASHLKSLRRIQETAIAFQHLGFPDAYSGSMLAIVSPPREGLMADGRAFGSASGFVARSTPRAVRNKFVVPPMVLTIKDSELKYLLILRLALARADLSYIGTANPTTVLTLLRLYRKHRTTLIDDIRNGVFHRVAELEGDVIEALAGRLQGDIQRADALERLHDAGGDPTLAALWPRLSLIGTWTFGSSGVAIDALRRELPTHARIVDIGYIASEFRGTIPLGRRSGAGFPTLDTHFFEFVERDKWDSGEPEFVTPEGLHKGVDYYVIVTTPSGLYRYFVNDLVRMVGRLHSTPLLRFVQKGKGVTNLTGEKLYESQVLSAVHAVLEQSGVPATFLMMLADEQELRYSLYIETEGGAKPDCVATGVAIDRKLAELNVEYRAKRESQRLNALSVHWLRPRAGDDDKRYCVQQGQREGQFKTVALSYRSKFSFDLDACVDHSS